MKEEKQVLDTNSDMWCIWNPILGDGVNSYEDWENKFYQQQNIIDYIENKVFVPINIGSSGAFEFTIKVGSNALLSQREKNNIIVESHTFWIRATEKLIISGVEYIEQDINNRHACEIDVEDGIYKVNIYLLDWKKESDMVDEKGFPKDGALSDFVILLNKTEDIVNENIKTVQTFPPPPKIEKEETVISLKPEVKSETYKTYQGKDYTQEEWKVFEEEEYQKYVEKRSGKKRSFLADEETEKQNFSAESGKLTDVKYFVMNSKQDKVPVYEYPSAMVAPFTFLNNGTAIEVIKYEENGWCEILSKEKKKAYIQSSHVKKNA